MKTPTLPIRYEIVNTGVTASASTLEQICCAVSSEGGFTLPGTEWSKGNGLTRVNVTTKRPIFAIRLKNQFPAGEPNRRTARFLDFEGSTTGNDAYLELCHVHGVTSVTGTWVDTDDSSSVEYSRDISAITAAHTHEIQPLMLFAGQAGKGGGGSASNEFINSHSFISQNYDSTGSEMLVVYATSASGTAACSSHISWIESE